MGKENKASSFNLFIDCLEGGKTREKLYKFPWKELS